MAGCPSDGYRGGGSGPICSCMLDCCFGFVFFCLGTKSESESDMGILKLRFRCWTDLKIPTAAPPNHHVHVHEVVGGGDRGHESI